MSYNKNTWAKGDVVTSAKLNNIEDGIASGGVLIAADHDGQLDKTFEQIASSTVAFVRTTYENGDDEAVDYALVESIGIKNEQLVVAAGRKTYIATAPNMNPASTPQKD